MYNLKYATYRLYTIHIYHNCVFVFLTQYDHVAKFLLEYNHDMYQQFKLDVSKNTDLFVFYFI